ncbi:Amidophosphoribosyltransferase 1, chloroplastic [Capsicum baccatum]|uniref:Amidophosphoribosyltransferase 1, chloroplastic n=1 Tax=Capsicum baccatum TaxID=33114 RepID=A0A2G2XRB5_CAPBA|nr:Amidophosphoribosyltransferase 1, chloroplastic [Capsicum baccatum]
MAAAAATAAIAAMNKPYISSLVDKPFCSPSQNMLSLATKTLSKPYKHHKTLTTCASKNLLTDVINSGQPNPDGHSFGSYFNADNKPREEWDFVGAGIVCVNDNMHKSITGVGLVFDVFSKLKLDRLPGDLAIGHVRIVEAYEKIEGAYSMVFATEDKLVAIRDPYGFRPLVMGRRTPEVVNQSHLHMYEQHHSGYHHGIDMGHPVLALNVTILYISVKEECSLNE